MQFFPPIRALRSFLILFFSVTFVFIEIHAAEKPNILLLVVDDMRTSSGSYRHPDVSTPHIDKLASQSVVFNRAYVNIPVCGASRASFLTGVRPTVNRFVNFKSRADEDLPRAVTLPQHFKSQGYHTISNGKVFHFVADSNNKSWSESAWLPNVSVDKGYTESVKKFRKKTNNLDYGPWYESADVDDLAYFDGQVAKKTLEDLRRLSQQDKPFFLAAGFYSPHLPFYSPKKYYDLYDINALSLAPDRKRPTNAPNALIDSREIGLYHFMGVEFNSDNFHRLTRHAYYASVSYTDQMIGHILCELEDLGLRENTIVVLVSDHGFNLGEHNFWGKHKLLEDAVRVPLMISAPGMPQNQLSMAMVELVDLYPTLSELAGIQLPQNIVAQLHGKSFADVVQKPYLPGKEYIVTRYKNGESIRSKRFALTEYSVGNNKQYMLFDHEVDPLESVNVYSKQEYQKDIEYLQQKLAEELARSK